ncbi:PREDICTED: TMV resistance protein N-like [Fragaria vesca subsp. vesca]|uniref:TMV resistance protein N-like n=1 Tax=Fragaria vesca subsp. vesca TaxID=101020 RepID=UPI0002C32F6C|nr:PREDICTED: TMV resistance protein N-like [Fragaria vesca subsp. vesca]
MDEPSSSSSLPTDVFLNFRGEDTRNIFVCHLHRALVRETLQVYIDKHDLQKGDDLENLLEGIAGSKLSILVFSENYATSTWCLKELVQILKCKKDQNQIVMPVFYKVDPSDIRKQRGSFGEAFAKHESDCKGDKELLQQVQSWRSALEEAANLSGFDSNSKDYADDAGLIDAIVKKVFDKVNSIPPHTEDGFVAMDSHLNEMRRKINAVPDGVVYVGICGMGGIGKTTIAHAVFREIAHQFDHCCFLEDVRERFTKGVVQLQREFLEGMFKKKEHNVDAVYMKMMRRLANKKILVVLDDVLDSRQMDTLLGGSNRSFGAGSIIIVTTRDEHVVRGFEIYKPTSLSVRDSLKLFSQNAFSTDKPSGKYEHLSRCIVQYAQGLPLALILLGKLLRKRSVSDWEGQLNKLRKQPHPGIKEVLQISFDGLQDEYQKNIFLDIACFFKGMDKDYVTIVLENCGFYPRADLNVLVERALLTISDSNKLEMHDLLHEMGRYIESSTEDGKRRRFWSEHVERVLTDKNSAATEAEGLMITLPDKEDRFFKATAFEHMTKLRLLMFMYREWYYGADGKHDLIGDFNFLSSELRVFIWHKYPLQCLPSSFDPKNLVHLDMHSGRIEHLWEGPKRANNLRIINLIGCPLKETPDLTEVPNLESLVMGGGIIGGRPSFTEVHPSILGHENLVFLSLAGCHELKTLPRRILMKSLKTLDLSHCVNLEMFPEISEDMKALSVLSLYQTAIMELPSSIERLRGLQSLDMTFCRKLIRLPDSICNLAKLRSLKLKDCSKLSKLPENIGNMDSLLELEVDLGGLEQLPVSILRLKLGGRLSFHGCKMAAPFSSWPLSIEDRCTDVVHLDFSGCNMMKLSDAIACFPSLKVLKLSRNNLERLPAAMKELGCLERLELDGCKRLRSIPELSSTISYINAQNCTALETVSAPQSPYEIGRCFIFSNCCNLVHEDVFKDIVGTHFPPQGNPSRPFYFSCPGSEILGQFIHSEGSSVTAKLPPNCFDNKFLGFAITAITNNPQGVDYYNLIVRCFFTFKGDQCQYRSSFYLFDSHFDSLCRDWLKSSHMLVGYVPWSEFGINGEKVNERHYTEAKFEIELLHSEVGDVVMTKARFDPSIERCFPGIKRCGVQFFFANNEDKEVIYQDFGEPMVQVLDNSEIRSLEGCSAEASCSEITGHPSDEEERFLKLSEVFEGAYRKPSRYMKTEDNEDSSGKRETLKNWKQKVKVTSGLTQGHLDDGFNWSIGSSGIERCKYRCAHGLGCWAKAIVPTPIDPTIRNITYVGRHTCWKTQPMLTHQVRITLGMETIGGPFDGFRWTKYDQRDILGSRYPREYYVCNPEEYGGCMAVKEVQKSNDQRFLRITYTGRHTCTLPSTGIGGRTDSSTSFASSASSGSSEEIAELLRSLGPDLEGIVNFLNNADNQIALRDEFSRARGVNDMENNNNNVTGCLCWFRSLWNFMTSKKNTPEIHEDEEGQ